MAVDFNILARVPTIGSQIMAGQEAGREAAARNMLLQQRQLEFQQAQEERQALAMERQRKAARETQEDEMLGKLSDLLGKSGKPLTLETIQEGMAFAVRARNPQAIQFLSTAYDALLKRQQAQEEAGFIADVYRGGAPAGASPTAAPTPAATPMAAPAAMPAPVAAAAPQELSALAVEQAAQPRPEFYGQGTFAGTAPTAVTSPVGEFPTEPAPRVNAMAPVAPVVNRMMAPPAPAPAVQVAGPTAMPTPAASRIDVPKLEAELEALEKQQAAFQRRGTTAALKEADKLQRQMDNIRNRIDRATTQTFTQENLRLQEQRVNLEARRADLQEARDALNEARFRASQKQTADAAARTERQLVLAERRFELARQQFQLANDPEHQARLTQIREASKLAAKSDSEVLTQGPSAVEAGQRTLALLNRMVGDPKGSGAAARPHPGFEGVVGAGVPGLRLVQGTPEADFDAMLKQAQGGAFLEAYERLKGTGQITEVEGQKATQAITRMNLAVSESEFMQAAKEFRDAIEGAMKRTEQRLGVARGRAPGAAPAAAAAPPAAGRTYPVPPQAAIDMLKSGKGTDAQFDETFGPGAAAKARGGR